MKLCIGLDSSYSYYWDGGFTVMGALKQASTIEQPVVRLSSLVHFFQVEGFTWFS